ncbi:hypothetical protein J6590_059482 [Homalodisca vitripennis]|nr:hypothetical protein J6590_059475 [Homalodisca vitripennis]KAG8310682.1 hypothetical protein J6590_059482 [Homalodisca vitripennis]
MISAAICAVEIHVPVASIGLRQSCIYMHRQMGLSTVHLLADEGKRGKMTMVRFFGKSWSSSFERLRRKALGMVLTSLARRLLCLLIHFFIALHRSSPHIIKLLLYTLILSKTLRLFGHCYDGILTLGDYIKAQARHLINSANSSEWDRIRARSSREGPGPLHKLRRTRALLVNPPYTPMYSQSYCLCLS